MLNGKSKSRARGNSGPRWTGGEPTDELIIRGNCHGGKDLFRGVTPGVRMTEGGIALPPLGLGGSDRAEPMAGSDLRGRRCAGPTGHVPVER